jgi:preprotein translocase subunit SecG
MEWVYYSTDVTLTVDVLLVLALAVVIVLLLLLLLLMTHQSTKMGIVIHSQQRTN